MTHFSKKKIISQKSATDLTSTNSRITKLENNVYKITYYEIVSGTSGSLTIPTGATINAGEFGLSGNSILSKINGSNKPTYESPKTAGGVIVTANLLTNGTWTTSGTYADASVALIYSLNISALNYSNLNNFYIIESEEIDVNPIVSEINFTGISSSVYSQGKAFYDTTNESLTFYNNDSAVALQIGQENWIRVTNNTGSSIANGKPVYINGTSGGMPTIALAKADLGATVICAGLTTETIVNGSVGYVTNLGLVRGLDTSAFTAGQTVYVSEATAGVLTTTAPLAPNFRFRVGIVVVSNVSTGTILVTPSTGSLGNGTATQILRINAGGTAQEFASPTTVLNNLSDISNPIISRNNLKMWDMFMTNGDQTTTSSTASNITDLVSPTLAISKRYKVKGVIVIGCNNTGGVKLQVTVPTGATLFLSLSGFTTSAAISGYSRLNVSATLGGTAYCALNSPSGFVYVEGEVSFSTTSGSIQFGFASSTNTQTSTIFQLGTQLTITQIN